jgi:hypothetical protein
VTWAVGVGSIAVTANAQLKPARGNRPGARERQAGVRVGQSLPRNKKMHGGEGFFFVVLVSRRNAEMR